MSEKYYLGLDCGTGSVGWAVTDEAYTIERKKGKALWGIRLFESANSAEDRRAYRAARRRTLRKHTRLDLLDELFEEEIKKTDANFFARLAESKYCLDDKNSKDKNTLFNDKKYSDIQFHKTYPTIYHLRKDLIDNKNPHDIRLVYLALHHILKHRGHFIFENQSLESTKNVIPQFLELQRLFNDVLEINLQYPQGIDEIKNTLVNHSMYDKQKTLISLFEISDSDNKLQKQVCTEIAKALLGHKTKLDKLFPDYDIEEKEIKDFEFKSSTYETIEDKLCSQVGEDFFQVILTLKRIYNWSLLDEMLHGQKYLSYAKVDAYEQHRKDLADLKQLMRKYHPDKYEEAFNATNIENNYLDYIGHGLVIEKNGKHIKPKFEKKKPTKSKCSMEAVNKYFKGIFFPKDYVSDNSDVLLNTVKNRLENNLMLPKAKDISNRTIPYQLNQAELQEILLNAATYLPFLNSTDDEGYSVNKKIIALMNFRIPYYVGPLVENDGSGKEYQKFSWMVRKDDGKSPIRPWKFKEQVDLPACGNAFIRKMTRKCTYLPAENVLPKNSLAYSEFSLLNELNNLRINGIALTIEAKEQLFNLFKKQKTVTQKGIRKFLIIRGYYRKDEELEITGIDQNIKTVLRGYIDFSPYLESNILSKDEVEEIIEWATIFSEGQDLLGKKLSEKYKDKLTTTQQKDILNKCKSYSGWGNLSKKFLTEMYDVDKATGECKSILTLMHETSANLMKLLSNKYTITKSVEEERRKTEQDYTWSYESLVEPLLVSPSVKRAIWQTLLVSKEIRQTMGVDPEKIFIEMAREDEKKGKRTVSRKEDIRTKLKNLTDNPDATELLTSIESQSDDNLRKTKLYLYYTQLGRCMYTNEKIDLQQLLSGSKRFDIDHIYPQSKVKDDSLDNRVLVLSNENGKKSDSYPLDSTIQQHCQVFWKLLLDNKLISKEKYTRLTRTTQFSDDEFENFIARQIVETRQSTKEIGRLLNKMCPNSVIVYSKARNVTDFRNTFELHKSRIVNDLHHAKDAYLNIVVGNTYYTKFTNDPRYIFSKRNKTDAVSLHENSYNLGKLFFYDIERNNQVAWLRDTNRDARIKAKNNLQAYPETGTIRTIRKFMERNDILFTRQCFQKKGAISDQTIVRHGTNNDVLPIKSSDKRLCKIEKYGGYNKTGKAYFFLVEHTAKGKRIKTFSDVPIWLVSQIDSGKMSLQQYCTETLGLKDPVIILPKILINTKIRYKGFIYEISGASGNKIALKTAVPLILDSNSYEYSYYLEKYLTYIKPIETKKDKMTPENKKLLELKAYQYRLSPERNIELYHTLLSKCTNAIYKNKVTVSNKLFLEKNLSEFVSSNIVTQANLLEQLLLLFSCRQGTIDLSLIGGLKAIESSKINRNLQDSITFIYQSATGIYEKRTEIKVP